ncbi:potassium channel, voltage-dependent transporter [Grosmannia clavigera kw1407]|uniref:Potassium channel, voltage-dependent transporter n=1 Tax=Grosmannia clavigera (strain kw1407 / UAMH 11150) TaxID=655863 RepID=F0XUH8_GROCL|nr:potassium channel, voltage-dependent transporter [Grosmannia clavigera kw1407]EFW98782.1 potassium channel, voltage-dependent transporter [Grosmannia clavigera kw1407]
MEQTFMTIHNLTQDANILFASESITDILGYQPAEVQGKSCFDFFHPEEEPSARSVHSRGVLLDKAAVLHYARLLTRDGRWIGCECCFTIVHDVLVACVSIYHKGAKSKRRAIEAPQIRRIFSCSPRDPRYRMLEHLSPKFKMSPVEREPRAALIVNRFTRNLTIMFATNATAAILGLRPDQLKNKSFYRCIQESCLSEAITCLESAKANDSIAYLRFSFQDPRDDEELEAEAESGVVLVDHEDELEQRLPTTGRKQFDVDMSMDIDSDNGSTDIFRIKTEEEDKPLSMPTVPLIMQPPIGFNRLTPRRAQRLPSVELEAVVSCTSDGLVVVLRKARPPIPPAHPPLVAFDYGDGLFAAPWAQHPIRPHFPVESLYTFRPPLLPQYMPLRENVKDAGGPPLDVLMGSIRDVAVIAWNIGTHPAIAAYGRGLPSSDARQNQQGDSDAGVGSASGTMQPRSINKGKGPAVPDALYGHAYAHDGRLNSYSCRADQSSALPDRRGSCGIPSSWTTQVDSASVGFGTSPPSPASFEHMRPQLRPHSTLETHPTGGITLYYGSPGAQSEADVLQPAYGVHISGPRPDLGSSTGDHYHRWG